MAMGTGQLTKLSATSTKYICEGDVQRPSLKTQIEGQISQGLRSRLTT